LLAIKEEEWNTQEKKGQNREAKGKIKTFQGYNRT
jgi:hypothetical protein